MTIAQNPLRKLAMNSFFKFSLFLLLVATSKQLIAQSSIEIPEDFNVISINGISHNKKLFSKKSGHSLIPGINKIALEYEVVYESNDTDDFDIITSEIFVMSFYVTANHKYKLQYLKQANSRAARRYSRNPVFKISDDRNNKVRTETWFLGSNSINFINQQTKPSVTGQSPLIITAKKKDNKTHVTRTEKSVNAEKMLEHWWSKASIEQRQSFLKKIRKTQ